MSVPYSEDPAFARWKVEKRAEAKRLGYARKCNDGRLPVPNYANLGLAGREDAEARN